MIGTIVLSENACFVDHFCSSEFIWPPLDRISDPLSCFHNGVVYKSTLSTKGCTAIIFFTQPCFVLRQQSNPVSIRRFENSNLDGDSRI